MVSKNLRHFLDDYHFEGIEELIDPKKLFGEVFQILCRKKYLVIESKGSERNKLSSLMVELYSDEIVNTKNEVITVRQFKHLNDDSIKRIYLNILIVSNETGMSFNNTK